MEFAVVHLIGARGDNHDFEQMTPEEQKNWFLFVQVVQAQTRFYEQWLMQRHLKRDPDGNRLDSLPHSVAAKIQAVKDAVQELKAEGKIK